ncbi:MAG: hypothetical protein B1H12_05190 [Desulfobacteraceae bacterium 4484_190.2]|nr:MAG: hypothetical protein B1H12_05190 [Desulfobacteraceae bacterium 4484_190.2]
MVKGIIPLNNQRVNDFKGLASLVGIKFAYDLCAEENLNQDMIFYSRYWLLYSSEGQQKAIGVLLNVDWRRCSYER